MLIPRVRSNIMLCLRVKTMKTCNASVHTKDDIFNYESKYSKDQEIHIFKKLNESNADDLSRLSLSQDRLKKILVRKSNNVRFESFSDLLNIDGFGVKIMEKMCDSILTPPTVLNETLPVAKKQMKGRYLEPALESLQFKNLKSATSVFISLDCIGWARIERDSYKLTDWNLHNIDQDDGKKLQLSKIMEIVWSVYNAMPKSDVYIMEAMPTILRSSGADANNPKTVHINLQKAQLVAMLSATLTALNSQSSDETSLVESMTDSEKNYRRDENIITHLQHKVFYLRSNLSSRLFKTFIGKERVSAQSSIDKILNQAMKHSENQEVFDKSILSKPLEVLIDKCQYYNCQTDVNKEYLCQTLMLIVTFMELCIYNNPNASKKFSF